MTRATVNPLEATTAQRKPQARKCSTCRDMGYLLPPDVDAAHREHVPAAVLYSEGVPCGCPAGDVFRWMAEEWAKPIPGGRNA